VPLSRGELAAYGSVWHPQGSDANAIMDSDVILTVGKKLSEHTLFT
jgi:hypothetical protein